MKHIVILAAAGMALVGCVKNEQPPIAAAPSDKPISFEAPVISKAPVGRASYVKYSETAFMVWGWYHEGDFTSFEDQDSNWKEWIGSNGSPVQVTKHDNENFYHPEDNYYWPKNDGKLTFAAYSPASLGENITPTHTKDGLQISNFVIPTNADMDVMYSDRAYNKTSSSGANDGVNNYVSVQIDFHHALSKICFIGKTTAKNANIKITKITVSNVDNKGTFNQKITRKEGETTDTSSPEWTQTSIDGTTTVSYIAFQAEEADADLDDETENAGLTSEFVNLGKGLILMPQSFTTSDDSGDGGEESEAEDGEEDADADKPKVTIEYTQNGVKCSDHFLLSEAENATTWEPGYCYTYRITIGLDAIHFAPQVEDWETPTEGGGMTI